MAATLVRLGKGMFLCTFRYSENKNRTLFVHTTARSRVDWLISGVTIVFPSICA